MFSAFAPFFVYNPFLDASSSDVKSASVRHQPPVISTAGVRPLVKPSESSVGGAASEFAKFFTDGITRSLRSFSTSLTALGSRTHAMFATITAALAIDRATRDTVVSFGYRDSHALNSVSRTSGVWAGWPWHTLFAPYFPAASSFNNPMLPSSFSDSSVWSAFSQGLNAFFGAPQPNWSGGNARAIAARRNVMSTQGAFWPFNAG